MHVQPFRCSAARSWRPILVLLFVCQCAALSAGTPKYRVDWYVMSSGSHSSAANTHYRVFGTVGQATIGSSESTDRVVTAGFWPGFSRNCDDCIFADGFEGVKP